jgi:hypothetical protein
MNTFDPLAIAIDWLDAYKANDLDAILSLYADDASIECACGGMATIMGKQALRAYWVQRLKDFPASDLDDIQPSGDGASISYVARGGSVSAILEFNPAGQISRLHCGPANGACSD